MVQKKRKAKKVSKRKPKKKAVRPQPPEKRRDPTSDGRLGVSAAGIRSAADRTPLAVEELRWRCDPASLPFRSTADVAPLGGVIGQDTAVEALRFGLEIDAPGQNIFVRGLTGTGRMTIVGRLLEEIRLQCPETKDRCYVHNFAQPDRPRLITLPRGRGRAFCNDVAELADFIRDELQTALGSEGVQARHAALEQETQRSIKECVDPFEASLRDAGLGLMSIQDGPGAQAILLPLIEGKAVPPEEWEQLRASGEMDEERVAEFDKQHDAHQEQLRGVMQKVNEIRRRHTEQARSLREQAVRSILRDFVEKIQTAFPQRGVDVFLSEVVDELALARKGADDQEPDDDRLYRANLLLGHADDESCPIVVENTPTVANLLGTIDHRFEHGVPGRSDQLMIRAGSLLRADGGYLILDARDLLREPAAWAALVRTLKTGRLDITPPEWTQSFWGPTLKPEPIDVKIKVILLGDPETYHLLDENDPDFPHLFKVLADFDSVVQRDDENIARYGGVLARIVEEEKLPHFEDTALAALLEHGARIAGRKDRLTTRFGRLVDIAREAAFVAGKKSHRRVLGDDVRSAINRTKKRAGLPSARFRAFLADGTIRVATTGTAVGQVNGLAVSHSGPLTFGFPTRITATIGPGSAGVINIEREADLSGAIHTKGFYILSGLLRYLLRTNHPLAFHASVAFEQSYGGIDGDSASAAEICCLLSALTDTPIRQDLAITGAIDQVGNILAVGATNEKIEGFFDTCCEIGLSGTQGVIIPRANARDLMLRADVVEACGAGRFRVYEVDSVREALELLTGLEAGLPNADGVYPERTLLGAAVARAFEFWLKAMQTIGPVEWTED